MTGSERLINAMDSGRACALEMVAKDLKYDSIDKCTCTSKEHADGCKLGWALDLADQYIAQAKKIRDELKLKEAL